MESNRVVIAALFFIIIIIAINYAMVVIARNWAKGDSRWMSAIKDALSKPMESSASKSMEELRKKVGELENKEQK